ncbi:RNA polymerase RpoH-like sigma 32 subunit [Phyllobacterium leguminum]|uniref:RNA polymerase RpoH-like sigma 32 subunit n=2 Tax=Phyllobacterium leguminum TaxID=314237 RepID=A0A318TBZ8_9HYPH|nr:RNA polymerase factor sigma-32 [Phyllobacterium leguminum]PYE88632.1 RNA polymerase RpoH-like sigma 32 subunit [Phyllobacterium leguminum]
MQQLAESRSSTSRSSLGRLRVSLDQSMMRSAMAAPYLARDEERELAIRWKKKKDRQALERIVSAHMRLVIAMASRFRKFNLPMSDLIQEGHVGLLEAAIRFDPEREVRFSTYATWWVRAAMQDHILRNWSIVRGGTSSSQKALFFNLRRLRARLAQSGEELSPGDIHRRISVHLGVPMADVELMDHRLSGPDHSLSAPIAGDEGGNAEGIDFLMDESLLPDEIAEETIDKERRSSWLGQALAVLNERELQIIRQRRLDDEGVTLETLGERLGISKERVRQIENRALEKLKTALLSKHELSAYQA